ncbi:hypothetical protein GOBAR_DD20062 [Gossypium barbadense]|nr:hypothetical protein GOBAR_DD20062 [Gossypium barbadense]
MPNYPVAMMMNYKKQGFQGNRFSQLKRLFNTVTEFTLMPWTPTSSNHLGFGNASPDPVGVWEVALHDFTFRNDYLTLCQFVSELHLGATGYGTASIEAAEHLVAIRVSSLKAKGKC